jgi:hypothetical protein
MKRVFAVGIFLVSSLFLLGTPHLTYAKKGGASHGGGHSDQGILYHSHSDRSYSGKEVFKGQGKALGRQGKKKKKHGSMQGQGPSSGTGSMQGQGPSSGTGSMKRPGSTGGTGSMQGPGPSSGTGSMQGPGSTSGQAPTAPTGPAPR